MKYRSYQHVERYNTDDTKGINKGKCYVFPKIDGTNGTVWCDDGTICAGNRKRKLSIADDNNGFCYKIVHDERFKKYFEKYPNHRLFGEWLTPHNVRSYKIDAWRKFYVFDVCIDDKETGKLKYLPYEFYKPFLEEFGIDYIPPIDIVYNGEYEDFTKLLDKNNFLIQEGRGTGEGIVIKNYEFKNYEGKSIWAKIVSSEFKNSKKMKKFLDENGVRMIEHDIVNRFVTIAFVEKEYAKIAEDGWNSRKIPILLNTVYHELITEEMWNILKKFHYPVIDFRTLRMCCDQQVKLAMPQLFC